MYLILQLVFHLQIRQFILQYILLFKRNSRNHHYEYLKRLLHGHTKIQQSIKCPYIKSERNINQILTEKCVCISKQWLKSKEICVYSNIYHRKTNPNKNQFRQTGTYFLTILWLQGSCYLYLYTVYTYKHDRVKLIILQILIPDVRDLYTVAALMSVTVVQYPLALLQPVAINLLLITNRHLFHYYLTKLHVITEIYKQQNKRSTEQQNGHQ